RQLALQNFKQGVTRVLVATDIAARGIDIDDLGYVINYEIPNIPETYVHRIGRTGRAGASGIAFSFCEAEERAYLKDIQKLIGKQIPVIHEHPFIGNAHAVSVPGPEEGRSSQGRHRQDRQEQRPGQNAGNRNRQQQGGRPEQKRREQPAQKAKQSQPPVMQQPPQQAPPPKAERPRQQPAQRPAQAAAPGAGQPPARKFKKPMGELSMPAKKDVKKDDFNSQHVPNVTPLFSDDDKW
ncbi:MAG: hypothetical protein MUF29_05150, partial [Chitinophagaceae bacterium]|nr:hypothetical protein [Chitinophagaceae bacterium]